jgi:DNA repair exonuclease SbcCD nuclease subunit
MSSRRPLRLLHTSDVHLGDGGASAQPAFASVIDLGVRLRADAILVAGDLFDHSRVGVDETSAFLAQVERFERPVIVLPGNHDCLDDLSVYNKPGFRLVPPNLRILAEDRAAPLHLPDLDLEVWGRPTVVHEPAFHPLRDVPVRQSDNWYVVLAHGHLVQTPGDLMRSSPILVEEIASAACDYIALGHWDVFRDVSQGAVTAFYSGSPRLGWWVGEAGAVMVELANDEVSFRRYRFTDD